MSRHEKCAVRAFFCLEIVVYMRYTNADVRRGHDMRDVRVKESGQIPGATGLGDCYNEWEAAAFHFYFLY